MNGGHLPDSWYDQLQLTPVSRVGSYALPQWDSSYGSQDTLQALSDTIVKTDTLGDLISHHLGYQLKASIPTRQRHGLGISLDDNIMPWEDPPDDADRVMLAAMQQAAPAHPASFFPCGRPQAEAARPPPPTPIKPPTPTWTLHHR